MVRGKKNVNITSPNVNVSSNNPISNVTSGPSRSSRRRNARRQRAAATNTNSGQVNTSGMNLMELQDMNSGRMTADPSSDLSFIRSIRDGKCGMDSNTEGWYFKYLDPAGAVETARSVGEFSKIPDGLLTFSVDAEIRIIDTLPVPLIEADIPGELPLGGLTWSLTIFSYPMFRTAYIAIANRFDKEISEAIAASLAGVLNNLTDYRATIDMNNWSPFAADVETGWYFWIKPLPPTYNLPDPFQGDQRTLTSWRMSYKSLTVEHNAPTLVDQGFWNGGHYALDSSVVQQGTPGATEMIASTVHGTVTAVFSTLAPAIGRYSVKIPNLPQLTSISGPAVLLLSEVMYFEVNADNTVTPVTFVVATGTAMYNPFEVPFATPGDTVSLLVTAVAELSITVTFTSTMGGSVPFFMSWFADSSPFVNVGAEADVAIFVDVDSDVFERRTSNQIEFPAYNPAQIAANNPKMEQFLMKETNGAYLVHKKMRKPVFEVTPASSFGPVQFTTPGYNMRDNSNDGSGILDTIDSNFSTASICVRGIAHANVPVVKLYQGWEGVTNVNTPFGQFGHSGLPRNDCVMELVDNLTVRTTGVYPANDNFLGLIAKFAAGALKTLLSSQATPSVLGNIAQGVINKGLGYVNNKLSQPRTRGGARMRGV